MDFIDHAESPPMMGLSTSGRNFNGGQELLPTPTLNPNMVPGLVRQRTEQAYKSKQKESK